MKDDLYTRRLPDIDSELKQQVTTLKKQLNIQERSDKLRFDSIWQNMDMLQKNNKMIMSNLQEMKARIDKIERSMGFYSGFEKHKY